MITETTYQKRIIGVVVKKNLPQAIFLIFLTHEKKFHHHHTNSRSSDEPP
ncbi:MAG: hypothetical protein RBS19_09565 [Bacteroidales bacterium]|nr:hypothetical protein [Bacteroidales bacterium]